MTRKQVPPGTRNARTGQYIRQPVRVQGSGSGSNAGCALTILAFVGAVVGAAVAVARAKGLLA